MKILSHGGYWKNKMEKNTAIALQRSFQLGYGAEIDVRDSTGALIIAHDMPKGREPGLTDVLDMAEGHASPGQALTLAMNIKADGLADAVLREISDRPALDCFAFDMSIPDLRSYLRLDIPVFARMSEVEQTPPWLEQCQGVWLDSFASDFWYSRELLEELLTKKRVCVVSAELHRRNQSRHWQFLKPLAAHPGLILCTDLPEEAERFFNGRGK